MTTATLAQPESPETSPGLQCQVLGENLLIALNAVKPALTKNQTNGALDIARHVLLRTDRGRLTITATNLDFACRRYVGAKIDNEGAVVVPSRTLEAFAKRAKWGTVSIEQVGPKSVRFQGCRITTTLESSWTPEDFPVIRDVEGPEITILGLPEIVKRVSPCVSDDERRPVLTGFHVSASGREFRIEGADGFRLGWQTAQLREDAPNVDAIVPEKAMLAAVHMLKASARPTIPAITFGGRFVKIGGDDFEVITEAIEGTFPDTNCIMPQSFTHTITISERLELLNAVEAVADIAARDGSGIVRLRFEDGRFTVSAKADELAEASAEVDIDEPHPEPCHIAANCRYLLDAIKLASGDSLTIHMNEPSDPAHFTADGTYGFLVMPMFVQW